MAASASVPNELLPALGQITATLLRKLSQAAAVSADAASTSGVSSIGVATSKLQRASLQEEDSRGNLWRALDESDVPDATSTEVAKSTRTPSSPSTATHVASPPQNNAPFSEFARLLKEHPELSPVPLFDGKKGWLALPPPGGDSLARWRRLPLVSLATFADNNRYFVSEETASAAFRPTGAVSGFSRSASTPEYVLRRALGNYASRLFLNPTSLHGVS